MAAVALGIAPLCGFLSLSVVMGADRRSYLAGPIIGIALVWLGTAAVLFSGSDRPTGNYAIGLIVAVIFAASFALRALLSLRALSATAAQDEPRTSQRARDFLPAKRGPLPFHARSNSRCGPFRAGMDRKRRAAPADEQAGRVASLQELVVSIFCRLPHFRGKERAFNKLFHKWKFGSAKSSYGVRLATKMDDVTYWFCMAGSYGHYIERRIRRRTQPFLFLDVGANQGSSP